MNKSILQNGDLIFMSDESELSKAIIETTEKYSHVGIYFDGYASSAEMTVFFLDGMTILYYILISQVSLTGQVGQ